jgi:hypothetical protein
MEKLRTLIERPVVAAVLGNAGWLLAEKALRLALGVAVSALVARYLGPEQFGVLNYALALVALFAVLANVGLDAVVVREIARNPGDREVLLGSAFALKAAGGALALCGALGAGRRRRRAAQKRRARLGRADQVSARQEDDPALEGKHPAADRRDGQSRLGTMKPPRAWLGRLPLSYRHIMKIRSAHRARP